MWGNQKSWNSLHWFIQMSLFVSTTQSSWSSSSFSFYKSASLRIKSYCCSSFTSISSLYSINSQSSFDSTDLQVILFILLFQFIYFIFQFFFTQRIQFKTVFIFVDQFCKGLIGDLNAVVSWVKDMSLSVRLTSVSSTSSTASFLFISTIVLLFMMMLVLQH